MGWIFTVKIHKKVCKLLRDDLFAKINVQSKKLFCQIQFGQFKTCVQIHWCEGSLGKSPVTLLHSFASQQSVSSYLFLPSVPIEREIKMERAAAAAHQLQSCHSTQCCSNLMKSNDEASSLVAAAGEQSWEGFYNPALCESVWERHSEKVKLLFGWRCRHYLSPYPLSPVLTPSPPSPLSLPPNPSHTPAVTRRWRPCNIQTTTQQRAYLSQKT